MRIYLDTEFLDNGITIELISVGLVKSDGSTLYLENSEFDWNRSCVSGWLRKNVKPYLQGGSSSATRSEIAQRVVEFVGPQPEFWAYFADYDWVVICQLYGRMLDVPKGWPTLCMDLKQEMMRLGKARHDLPVQISVAHNALNDAIWVKDAHEHLMMLTDR